MLTCAHSCFKLRYFFKTAEAEKKTLLAETWPFIIVQLLELNKPTPRLSTSSHRAASCSQTIFKGYFDWFHFWEFCSLSPPCHSCHICQKMTASRGRPIANFPHTVDKSQPGVGKQLFRAISQSTNKLVPGDLADPSCHKQVPELVSITRSARPATSYFSGIAQSGHIAAAAPDLPARQAATCHYTPRPRR